MRTDHRPPAREFGYAVLPDWQPAPRWPLWIRALVMLVGSGLAWGVVIVLVLEIGWAIHG